MVIRGIHRLLDIVEFIIIVIDKSYYTHLIRKLWFWSKYYLMEEGKLQELIVKLIYKIKNNNKKVKYFVFFNIYSNIILFLVYFQTEYIKNNIYIKRLFDLNMYSKLLYSYIHHKVIINVFTIYYNFKTYKIVAQLSKLKYYELLYIIPLKLKNIIYNIFFSIYNILVILFYHFK